MTDLQTPVPGDASEALYAAITEHVIGLAHAIETYAHAGSAFDPPLDVREQTAERLVMNRLFVEFTSLRASLSGRDAALLTEVKDEVLTHHVLDQWLPKLLESRAAVIGLAGRDVTAAMDRETEALHDRITLAAYLVAAEWAE
jgi:hypothetical protein